MQISAGNAMIHRYFTDSLSQCRSNLLPKLTQQTNDNQGLSDVMRAKIREVDTFARRSIKLLMTADNSLQKADTSLSHMKELALKATDETLTDADRLVLQKEINLTRAEIDRNAYDLNEKIREKLGLPQVKGSFDAIAAGDLAAVSPENNQDDFNKNRFVYKEDSDEEFQDYVIELQLMAKKHKSILEYKTADTIAEIWNAMKVIRPASLGVDQLDVTSVEKAKAALEKIGKAQGMVTKERSLIQGQVKKWLVTLQDAMGLGYSNTAKITKNDQFLDLVTELNISA